ncbi:hypothetical protein PVAP13_7KG182000 [Panicum virgatum]|uniref:Uncharacterized protein n=1 Tax=Panicum virgatum TaxID=38727 RepID=A0A8T0QER9_PANVG|nr:hypothetical protein PVAP13_7KG182000 [Panicum virgatum]
MSCFSNSNTRGVTAGGHVLLLGRPSPVPAQAPPPALEAEASSTGGALPRQTAGTATSPSSSSLPAALCAPLPVPPPPPSALEVGTSGKEPRVAKRASAATTILGAARPVAAPSAVQAVAAPVASVDQTGSAPQPSPATFLEVTRRSVTPPAPSPTTEVPSSSSDARPKRRRRQWRRKAAVLVPTLGQRPPHLRLGVNPQPRLTAHQRLGAGERRPVHLRLGQHQRATTPDHDGWQEVLPSGRSNLTPGAGRQPGLPARGTASGPPTASDCKRPRAADVPGHRLSRDEGRSVRQRRGGSPGSAGDAAGASPPPPTPDTPVGFQGGTPSPQPPSNVESEHALPGAPRSRPRETFCYIKRDASIRTAEEALLFAVVMVARDGIASLPIEDVRAAIAAVTESRLEEIVIRPFYPEHFIVFCGTQERTRSHAVEASLSFRVNLVLEGIPPHVWREDTVAKILSPSCWVQSVDPDSSGGGDLSSYRVTAWTAHLSLYLREVPTLGYEVLIHLRTVADFSGAGGSPPPPGDSDARDGSQGGLSHFGPHLHSFPCDRGIPDADVNNVHGRGRGRISGPWRSLSTPSAATAVAPGRAAHRRVAPRPTRQVPARPVQRVGRRDQQRAPPSAAGQAPRPQPPRPQPPGVRATARPWRRSPPPRREWRPVQRVPAPDAQPGVSDEDEVLRHPTQTSVTLGDPPTHVLAQPAEGAVDPLVLDALGEASGNSARMLVLSGTRIVDEVPRQPGRTEDNLAAASHAAPPRLVLGAADPRAFCSPAVDLAAVLPPSPSSPPPGFGTQVRVEDVVLLPPQSLEPRTPDPGALATTAKTSDILPPQSLDLRNPDPGALAATATADVVFFEASGQGPASASALTLAAMAATTPVVSST